MPKVSATDHPIADSKQADVRDEKSIPASRQYVPPRYQHLEIIQPDCKKITKHLSPLIRELIAGLEKQRYQRQEFEDGWLYSFFCCRRTSKQTEALEFAIKALTHFHSAFYVKRHAPFFIAMTDEYWDVVTSYRDLLLPVFDPYREEFPFIQDYFPRDVMPHMSK